MAEIVPVQHAMRSPGGTTGGTLDRASFEEIQVASADLPGAEGTKWLRLLPIPLGQQVTVLWDPSTAIQTTWEVFTQYWDDFCYPSSDDVEIFPNSGTWLLLYHHWEQFEWGRRRHA